MAFISEIHYRSGDVPPDEFMEITMLASEDPADYTVSFYRGDGTLRTDINVDGAVNGELTLDSASVTVVPHPDNPDYVIYTITSNNLTLFTTGGTVGGEARAVTLTNTATGTTVDGYTVGTGAVTPTEGEGAGYVTTDSGGANSGQSLQWDINGNQINGVYTHGDSVICFDANTHISTLMGPRLAGSLEVGDKIKTLSGRILPIEWVHKSTLSSEVQAAAPNTRPIRITAGALGDGYPRFDLVVSPQHRIMLRSKICERVFGEAEVLVAAKHLLGIPGISVVNTLEPKTYVHFLLPEHSIILANGHPCETLLPGPMALESMSHVDPGALRELIHLAKVSDACTTPARLLANKRKALDLIERHLKNEMPFVTGRSYYSDERLLSPLANLQTRAA